ncbi:MAG: type II/IV secretion system protein [Candidatus Moraniibacteriota bacterium]|nr:MAG: type II/IV secretion system protein [Candidatus Moranbacteria bacterium]
MFEQNTSKTDVATKLSTQGGAVFTGDGTEKINPHILRIIPEDTARKYRVVAVEQQDNVVRVIMEDTQNVQTLSILQFLARKEKIEFDVMIAKASVIDNVLGQYETAERLLEKAVQNLKDDDEASLIIEDESDADNVVSSFQDAPVAKLVDVISKHAIEGKASDIHIEPVDREYRVRFRVDGVLHSSLVLPKEVGKAVVARIKILSNLKIDEKRKPQDGRFRIGDKDKYIDFRVSTLPVLDGEKVVMRVLDKNSGLGDMTSLGLMGRNSEVFTLRIRDPYGIILLTGPTGSGKSTTLYTFLRILNKETTNIVTLEDPVEYLLDGINQSQVHPEIGYTFAAGLRSILRQDPNVIMVGEIRDAETAELSIHAALTGHLVFSTLHTNTAIGAIPRLIDMGMEGFLLSSALRVVAAQRLVRRICPQCKEEQKVPGTIHEAVKKILSPLKKNHLEDYKLDLENLVFYKGAGCDACGQTGYKGRVAIYEVLDVDDEMTIAMTQPGLNEDVIEKLAIKQGMMFLKQDGLLKALQGLTTISEVERVTEGKIAVGGDMSDDVG